MVIRSLIMLSHVVSRSCLRYAEAGFLEHQSERLLEHRHLPLRTGDTRVYLRLPPSAILFSGKNHEQKMKKEVLSLFVNIVRWRIPKEKSNEQFKVWREMMDYQKSHPEKVYYTRSRFFNYTEKGSSDENWMFLDEYKRREDYDKWRKAVNEDPDLIKLMETWFPKWDALIVPGSRKGEVWNEVENLRVEFK